MSNQIGITVAEGIANGLNLGTEVGTRNIGLLVERERGVPNKPFLFNTPNEDAKVMGGFDTSMYSPYVVRNLFDNLQGFRANVYQIRIVGAGSVPASGVVQEGATTILTIKAGYQGMGDPGTWGNKLKVKAYPKGDANGMVNDFLLEVYLNNIRKESFFGATWEALMSKINIESSYILAEAGDFTSAFTVVDEVSLAGGAYIAPTQADMEPGIDAGTGLPKGMQLFESVDVQIVACPEFFSMEFHQKCDAFAKAHDKFYVLAPAMNATESILENLHNGMVTSERSHSAGFYNWVEVDNGNGGRIWIPGIGYYLGAGFVRAAALNNGHVWTPPAGSNTRPVGIYRFSHEDITDAAMDRYATKWRINGVRYVNNRGYSIYTSRTYSSSPLFHSIHISLETNWLKAVLKERNQKYLQRINDTGLRNEMRLDTLAFMRNLYAEGGVENSVDFDTAVQVQVSVSPTDRKRIEEEMLWIPPETTEAIAITLSRNDGVLVLQG